MNLPAEQSVCCYLRAVLEPLANGEWFENPLLVREISGLEYYLSNVLSESYPEWRHESLDGIFPFVARKLGPREVEIVGYAILITDQALAPIHVRLGIAAHTDEITWLECLLGKLQNGMMVRRPYRRGGWPAKELAAIADNVSAIAIRWRLVSATRIERAETCEKVVPAGTRRMKPK